MSEEKNRIDYKAITLGLLVTIIVFILFNIIKIPIPEEKVSTELRPFVVLDYYTAQEKVIDKGKCVARNFSYSYSWEGWDSGDDDFTTPYLEIINYENQTGIFAVQFAFFDESKYPYNLYKNSIKWEDATTYSDEMNITLKPQGSNTISIPTLKLNKDASYWAIGDIKAPVLFDCGENTEYKTVVKNKTVTEYKEAEKSETVVNKVSIWDYIFRRS